MGDVLPFKRPPDEDGVPTRPCPYCGKTMYLDAVRCRHCREAVPPGAPAARRRLPWWFFVVIILALVIAFGLAFGT